MKIFRRLLKVVSIIMIIPTMILISLSLIAGFPIWIFTGKTIVKPFVELAEINLNNIK